MAFHWRQVSTGAMVAGATAVVAHTLGRVPKYINPSKVTAITVVTATSSTITFRNDGSTTDTATFILHTPFSVEDDRWTVDTAWYGGFSSISLPISGTPVVGDVPRWNGSAWVRLPAATGFLPLAGGTLTGTVQFNDHIQVRSDFMIEIYGGQYVPGVPGDSIAFFHFTTDDTGHAAMDGTHVGIHWPNGFCIWSRMAKPIYFGTGDALRWEIGTLGHLRPSPMHGTGDTDNVFDLGYRGTTPTDGARVRDIFAASTISGGRFGLLGLASADNAVDAAFFEYDATNGVSLANGANAMRFNVNRTKDVAGAGNYEHFAIYNGGAGVNYQWLVGDISQPRNAHAVVLCYDNGRTWGIGYGGSTAFAPQLDATTDLGLVAVVAEGGGRIRNAFLAGYLSTVEMAEPGAPADGGVYLFAMAAGAGKTKLMAKFASGAAQQVALEP